MTTEQSLVEELGTAQFSESEPPAKNFGWEPEDDPQDWVLEERMGAPERTSGIQRWLNPIQLFQNGRPACVGFAAAGLCNAEPLAHSFGNDMGIRFWQRATFLDQNPRKTWKTGQKGTTLRAGAKALREAGHIKAFAFTQNVETLAMWVLNRGPAMIAVKWDRSMRRVGSDGFIHPSGGRDSPGHAVLVDGVVWNVEGEVNRFRIRNSWGLRWGFNGRCLIVARELQGLFDRGGTACTAVEVA